MTRISLSLLLGAVLIAAVAVPEARAHGGNFRQGNPAPGPRDAAPPPPSVPVPGPRTPRPAGLDQPTTWRKPRVVGTLYDWQTWWFLNRSTLLPPRRPERTLRVGPVTPTGDGRVLPHDFVQRLRWRRRVDESAKRIAVPFFVELLESEEAACDELVGAALIALARSTRDATAVPYLRRYAFDRRAGREVRECAIVGMGLARRSRAGEQLSVDDLVVLRRDLMRIFDDDRCDTRLRSFAVYSLALLADQPYGEDAMHRYGRDVTRWIERRLRAKYANEELAISLLIALGHQPRAGVPTALLGDLKDLVVRRHAFGRKWSDIAACQALQTLARLGAPDTQSLCSTLLRSRRAPEALQCTACLALAIRARELSSEERVDVSRTIRRGIRRLRRSRLHRVGLLTLGAILGEDLAADAELVLTETPTASMLRQEMRHGSTRDRPYAALALGLATRNVTPSSRPKLAFLVETRRALTWGLEFARGPDRDVAAFAVAAGLARATEARPLLLEMLRDTNRHHDLRGHCAVALAELGHRDQEIATALLDASRERIHPTLHGQAVRALSILGIPGTGDDLLAQFAGNKTRGALIAVASSLGRLGDPAAADRMVQMARDGEACSNLRIASVVGLGLLFDREVHPSRTRLSRDASFMALTHTLAGFIDIH